jgi:SAM-dependent methyltransferase
MRAVWIKQIAKMLVPENTRRWLRSRQKQISRGPVNLHQTEPMSRVFGMDRGEPIDRYYIEKFLLEHAEDIRGRVLEIGDDTYTKKYGGLQVFQGDILHAVSGNPKATIVADLTAADAIPSGSFDCIILTQTLQFVFDLSAALSHVARILKPGGVVLATVPGISQISRYDMDRWGDHWRFTSLGISKMFAGHFDRGQITVRTFGNVLTASGFLYGLACDELKSEELEVVDPAYELLITVRARRAE